MTKGPNRQNLDAYLDSAMGGHLQAVGRDWNRKAQDLQTLSEALKTAAAQAELRIGEQTLTGPALRAGMEKSSTSMSEKSGQLRNAGDALVVVGQQINDTKDARDSMADLGTKPAAYQAPANTTGVEPTTEELQAQADASAARQAERNAWQTAYDKQEARALALTKDMDAAFLGAIPPMQEIHGQQDPTEPPPEVPAGPGGPYLPGTQAPPPTGGAAGRDPQVHWTETGLVTNNNNNTTTTTVTTTPPTTTPPTTVPPTTVPPKTVPTHPITTTPTNPTVVVPTETTSVIGNQQSGVTYQPTGPSASVSAPTSGGSTGVNAAAMGAAGAAGGASGMAGAVRAGSAPAPAGSAPARPIGSTARSGSAGALSRSASAPGSPATRAGAAPGSSTAARGAAGSAGGRGAASGSTAGRGAGSAGGRGAASGSSAGSRSGGRGSTGARGAAGGGTGARGGRKGERDKDGQRDSLVYDQDWLGDEDVAPGVLD